MPPDDAHGATRRAPRGLLIAAAVLLVARVVLGIVEARNAPEAAPVAERVAWLPIEEGVDRARRQLRPILYAFVDERDPICRTMREELFSDPHAAEAIERVVVPVKVTGRDTSGSDAGAALRRRFRVRQFPTLVIVPPGDEPLTFEGYPGPGGTLQWITTVATTRGFSLPRPFPADTLPQ